MNELSVKNDFLKIYEERKEEAEIRRNRSTKLMQLDEMEISVLNAYSSEYEDSSLSQYECTECGWRFIGEVWKQVGNTTHSKDCPNYCPMCGKEIAPDFHINIVMETVHIPQENIKYVGIDYGVSDEPDMTMGVIE